MGHPEPVTTAVPPSKPKGRWRWFRRVAVALFALMLLGIGGYTLSWKLTRREGRQRVEAVSARLDADDPGWRFADIVADHNSKVPPVESNSALRAVGIVERLPKEPDPERSAAYCSEKRATENCRTNCQRPRSGSRSTPRTRPTSL